MTDSVRNDGYGKVTGRARYADDFVFPGMVHCVPVYSDYVHAVIRAVHTERAEAAEGVLGVFTAADVPGDLTYGQILRDYPILVGERIRSFGDVVAIVAAETREQALRAAELVTVEADELPPVFDPEEALEPGAPLLYPERGTNLVVHHKIRRGNAREEIEKCHLVLEEEFTTGFFEHAYMEPEGAVCIPREDGVLEIVGSLQFPSSTRKFVCAYLGLPFSEVEVVSHAVGGSFGGKDDTASAVCARAALAAHHLKRPAKIIYDREWSMRESYKRPSYRLSYRMGFDARGKLEAVVCRGTADSGAYTSTVPWSTWRATVQCCGPYTVEHVHTDIYGSATNNVFTGAFRGFGSPPVNFAVEQCMDIAAERLGMTPEAIREVNMVRQGSRTITGQKLDNHTVSMDEVMEAALAASGYTEKVSRCSYGRTPGDEEAAHELYGIGFAVSYRGASIGAEGKDFACCIVNCQFDGSIFLETGIWENGQGAQQAMITILARQLSVDPTRIRYVRSTTSSVPDSGTTVASRGTLMGSGAICDAVEKLQTLIAETLAADLGCSPPEVRFEDDRIIGRNGTLSWNDAMARMYDRRVYPFAFGSFQAPEISWDEEVGRGDPYFTYVYSCQVVEVAVDPESGRVRLLGITAAHDIGKAVNPIMLRGQIFGGAAQGLGMALTEDLRYEEGNMKSLNYNSYRIPRSVDVPEINPVIIENPDPVTAFGCKGIGEPALEITAPAIANALYRATGKRFRRLPVTVEPMRIDIGNPREAE
jgi:CO/xanthine dehydrogenase Mo-binding subunit